MSVKTDCVENKSCISFVMVAFQKATSKVGSVQRTSSSLEQPLDTTIVVSAGAWATISFERNLAKSPLLSPRERNACYLIGSGTCLPSIIHRTGRAVFLERRPLVVAFMECLR